LQEINDPSQSIDRARENWQKLGRSEKWIQQRMTGQEMPWHSPIPIKYKNIHW
jgi:hypothetical protein